MKKVFLLVLSICMMLISPLQIFAEEPNDFTINNFKVEMKDNKVNFEFKIDDSNANGKAIDAIVVTYGMKEDNAENFSQMMDFYLKNGDALIYDQVNQKWMASVDKDFSKNGIWEFCGIDIVDEKYATMGILRDTSGQYNLTVNDVVTYKAPIIKSMSLQNDLANKIDAGQYMKLNLDIEYENKLDISLVYKNETTNNNEYLNVSYDERLKEYLVYLEPEMQYKGESFKFLYAITYTFGEQLFNVRTEMAYYTPFSKEELKNYDVDLESTKIGDECKYVYSMSAIKNMDILLNYSQDTQFPCIEETTAVWKNKDIVQPGIATLQYKVNDFGESGVEFATVIYELNGKVHFESTHSDVTGVIADHSLLETSIPISRYDDAQNTFKVIGLFLVDYSKKCHVYYADTDDENIDKIYEAYNLDAMSDIENTPITIEQPTFTKYQTYDKMINSHSSTFISDMKTVQEGETIVVNYSHVRLIPEEIFSIIQGKDITLIFDIVDSHNDKGVQWVINGKDITNPKAIDLSTEMRMTNDKVNNKNQEIVDIVYNELVTRETANNELLNKIKAQEGTEYYVNYLSNFDIQKDNFYEKLVLEYTKYERNELVFKNNGELPGVMTIRYNPEFTFRGYLTDMNLNCYYVNGDQYELIKSDIPVSLDQCYEFDITHNSTYLLTMQELVKKDEEVITPTEPDQDETVIPDNDKVIDNKPVETKPVETFDSTSYMIYFMSSFMGLAVIRKYFKFKNK